MKCVRSISNVVLLIALALCQPLAACLLLNFTPKNVKSHQKSGFGKSFVRLSALKAGIFNGLKPLWMGQPGALRRELRQSSSGTVAVR